MLFRHNNLFQGKYSANLPNSAVYDHRTLHDVSCRLMFNLLNVLLFTEETGGTHRDYVFVNNKYMRDMHTK